jgi:hypothetical protein
MSLGDRGHDTTLGRFPRTAGGLRLMRKLAFPRGSYTELSDAGNYNPYRCSLHIGCYDSRTISDVMTAEQHRML